ncbi:hypothetical protein A0H81_06366 [Grifola frondosa]|uniref:Uncharacterized protein n=1 Tax=Grifola frondosa TaxID=5627 RepID=A0A1C7MAY9_GRIFR|nr:hypothetical protein A0H81_06366 [Grifola frondosa]
MMTSFMISISSTIYPLLRAFHELAVHSLRYDCRVCDLIGIILSTEGRDRRLIAGFSCHKICPHDQRRFHSLRR